MTAFELMLVLNAPSDEKDVIMNALKVKEMGRLSSLVSVCGVGDKQRPIKWWFELIQELRKYENS